MVLQEIFFMTDEIFFGRIYPPAPESGCSDQKLPLPGLSGVRGTFTKQSLKDSECLKCKKLFGEINKDKYLLST